jgi:hypothetical protein
MSTSLTVVGGVSGSSIAGIVTVPTALPGSLVSALQSYLSGPVATTVTGGANFQNLNIGGASGNISDSIASGSGSVGLLDITNTDTHGAIVSGARASVSFTVNNSYNALAVEAPGDETVTGNGQAGFLAVFSSISAVTFNTGGGSGTVAAGGLGDVVNVEGANWVISGDTVGGDTISGIAADSSISVYGAGSDIGPSPIGGPFSNVVSMGADNVTVISDGVYDDITDDTGTGGVVSILGGAQAIVDGGTVTVYAAAGQTYANAHFEENGGKLIFINQSASQATVAGAIEGAVGGNVTAFGGSGGGVYVGGPGGDNSLVGGAGLVTLYAAGGSSSLYAASDVGGINDLFGGTDSLAGGAVYMQASVGSGSTEFTAYTGSTTAVSYGSGGQAFFAGQSGQDSFVGSTVTGAVNYYYFDQDSTGAGSDIITNFRIGTDHLYINGLGSLTGVSIAGIASNPGSSGIPNVSGGVVVSLSDQTTIKLYGVSLSAADAASVLGGGYSL